MRNQVLHLVSGPKIVGSYLNSLLYGVLFVLFSQGKKEKEKNRFFLLLFL